MIQLLASTYQRRIAFLLFFLFDQSLMLSSLANRRERIYYSPRYHVAAAPAKRTIPVVRYSQEKAIHSDAPKRKNIGGPTQPEMTSFKSVGSDNMVNLFTGDFSYNIPLLDVGGYPLNIFYNGGVSMEQEASWVGLGWNINPGNISRNMRGVPDDFNGEEKLVQKQNMKPNKTWGVSTGADFEWNGIKTTALGISLGGTLGVSFNNYLGLALDLGFKGGVAFKVANITRGEKDASIPVSLKLGVGGDLNSRSGLSLSPNVSLSASTFINDKMLTAGLGVSTSYNSRAGIKEFQISEQMSANKTHTVWDFRNLDHITNKQYSSTNGANLFSTSISFARPSYIPSIRIPLNNEAYSGHFQIGSGLWGIYVSGEFEIYNQISKVSKDKILQIKPLVGYLYADKAVNNPNAVMDFTRFNDREVTPHTPIVSAPQYSYDVFYIQGEGTGGSIRACRNDLGTVRDNATGSQDKSTGIGLDLGIPGHYGANVNLIKTPTTVGEWKDGNKLHAALAFQPAKTKGWENVYFRNPGEASVIDNDRFTRLGGIDLVRFKLGGEAHSPTVEPVLDRFSKSGAFIGSVNAATTAGPVARQKRTQVIDFLTAADASVAGLDKQIKIYDNQAVLKSDNTLNFSFLDRYGIASTRKDHHISQINVTESNGKRYIYGIPVYNTVQKDFTFTVGNESTNLTTPGQADQISYNDADMDPAANPAIGSGVGGRDGYAQIMETPAYAHSFLLSGLLSPDYVDVTGDGITEDDLGTAVKFNYTEIKNADGSPMLHAWRSPMGLHKANFNAGKLSELKDDKGLVSYGQRESWYPHSVESKTMIAFFILDNRADGKGVVDEKGAINPNDNSLKCLKEIRLYSKADLKKNGWGNAKPIKTVHFCYSYRLCQGTPDNPVGSPTSNDPLGKGKLTLDNIYFTYNGQDRLNKNQYVFSYVNSDGTGNPIYIPNANDRWGTYKSSDMNPAGMKNSDYPYTPQDQITQAPKTTLDQNAGAWALKKVLLPSGGQLEVNYESDDYAFVQNRRATDMMSIAGFGNSPTSIPGFKSLYDVAGGVIVENNFLFITVPTPCAGRADVYEKYLRGMDQLATKLAVKMPKGVEYLTSYANIDDYGKYNETTIWIKLRTVNGLSPLSVTAIEFLREQLPGQAFTGYDVSESSGLQQIGESLIGWLKALKGAFSDPATTLRKDGKARFVELSQSFARLNDPDGIKFGGGHRVKSILLQDNWKAMTKNGQSNAAYGLKYDYTTKEIFAGTERTISSGVASYEPSPGGDENPFQTIMQVADKLPLGPVSYGAVEMPVLDAFFPAPSVGYSKVTVKSIPSVKPSAAQKSRSGIGRQVTEFYTAKDYPVYYSNTSLDPVTDKQAHDANTTNFFYKYAFDSRALSQGFLIETNDMHGKLKSQSSYAENDPTLRVNYLENFYRNTGARGLNDQFDFVSAKQGGIVSPGNVGIDVELMTDTREFSVKSSSIEIQGQVDLYPVIFPFWLPFIWPVFGNSENTYRAVTTTKVITYHSILDGTIVIDKGSQVSTKNLVYDSETGQVVVSRTNNEFDQPVYNTNYPAWWAYSGMGPSYLNIGLTLSGIDFQDGKIVTPGFDQSIFESGDELTITGKGTGTTSCPLPSADMPILWVLDKNKSSSSLTDPAPDLIFIDALGNPYTKTGVSIRITRSGKRNILDAMVASAVTMKNPVTDGPTKKLAIDNAGLVISAAAREYKEKWQTDKDMIETLKTIADPNNECKTIEVEDCDGYLEKNINPYCKGLLGDFRAYRNLVFYGDRMQKIPTQPTNLPTDGFLSNFKLYWDFDPSHALAPDPSSTKWVWNSELMKVNSKGQELETKDALNRYTSAQYGYDKSLPVSIVQNARSGEAFYEGFEDYNYSELLNKPATCTNRRYIDLTGTGSIVNADASAGITAHSGKYVLKVNQGTVGLKTINVINSVNEIFPINFSTETSRNPYLTGGVINNAQVEPFVPADNNTAYQTPQALWEGITTFSNGGFSVPGVIIRDSYFDNNKSRKHYFTVTNTYYINVLQSGNYDFHLRYAKNEGCYFTALALIVNMERVDGVGTQNFSLFNSYGTDYTNVFVCKGLYKVTSIIRNAMQMSLIDNPTDDWLIDIFWPSMQSNIDPCMFYQNYSWGWYIPQHAWPDGGNNSWGYPGISFSTNAANISYKSLETIDGCTRTLPLAAADDMLNPTYSLTPGKKMYFSSWVREACTSSPCTRVSYSDSKVELDFGSAGTLVPLKPTGAIIEGWQKVEGEFTVPQTATTMKIKLINNGTAENYWDDIRIHPFNADMKSYVYDPVNLRLVAEMDGNNYATFYEYDEEGTLTRTKAETRQGIKTIKETRSAKQKDINTLQPISQ